MDLTILTTKYVWVNICKSLLVRYICNSIRPLDLNYNFKFGAQTINCSSTIITLCLAMNLNLVTFSTRTEVIYSSATLFVLPRDQSVVSNHDKSMTTSINSTETETEMRITMWQIHPRVFHQCNNKNLTILPVRGQSNKPDQVFPFLIS